MKNDNRVICCTLLTNITFLAERESVYTGKLKSVTSAERKSYREFIFGANVTLIVSNRRFGHYGIAKLEESKKQVLSGY